MEPLIPLDEIAKRLGVSKYTAKERIKEAGIRGPRAGREMRFTEDDYWLLIEKLRQRQRGGYSDPAAVKAAVRKMRMQQTRRLGKKHTGPVVALNLERPKKD